MIWAHALGWTACLGAAWTWHALYAAFVDGRPLPARGRPIAFDASPVLYCFHAATLLTVAACFTLVFGGYLYGLITGQFRG